MKIEIVAMYDSAAQMFGRPFFVQTVGIAIRSFSDEIQRQAPDNDLFKHPDDFTLYHLGAFDDSLGAFSLPEQPVMLIRGKDLATKLESK